VLAVVGGGDAAVEEAAFLTRYASKVLLIHRRDKLRAERVLQERLFANNKIEVVWDTVVEEIAGEGKVQRILTRNVVDGTQKTLEVGGIFIYVGFDPTSNIFRDPIEKDEMGFIITDDRMETSQPGIFCAGDVRHQFVRQITNATGDATTAAVAVTRLLESLADQERESPEPGLKATASQYP
jgi:thioredoxin reductase (NADPH)